MEYLNETGFILSTRTHHLVESRPSLPLPLFSLLRLKRLADGTGLDDRNFGSYLQFCILGASPSPSL